MTSNSLFERMARIAQGIASEDDNMAVRQRVNASERLTQPEEERLAVSLRELRAKHPDADFVFCKNKFQEKPRIVIELPHKLFAKVVRTEE